MNCALSKHGGSSTLNNLFTEISYGQTFNFRSDVDILGHDTATNVSEEKIASIFTAVNTSNPSIRVIPHDVGRWKGWTDMCLPQSLQGH